MNTTENNKLRNQVDDSYSIYNLYIYYIKDLIKYIERLKYENEELKEQINLLKNTTT